MTPGTGVKWIKLSITLEIHGETNMIITRKKYAYVKEALVTSVIPEVSKSLRYSVYSVDFSYLVVY